MKKYIAFLLCFMMILSLFSCTAEDGNNESPDTNTDTEKGIGDTNTEPERDTEENSSSEDAEQGEVVEATDYYKIVSIGLGKSEYRIYDRWGKEVLVEVTDKPLRISFIDQWVVEIRIGMGTGTSVSKYYDVRNECFSEEYLYVVAVSGNLLAYVDASPGHDADKGTFVVRDIFDGNGFFKAFSLNFSPREVMPISRAEFTEREMALELVYLDQTSRTEESVTLPIRTSTFDPNAFNEADKAMMAYDRVLKGNEQVLDTSYQSYCYLQDVRTPYSNILLHDVSGLGYAYTDMDGDGVCELVIDCGDTLILRYYEKTVCLYSFTFRNLYDLRTDGSHSWNHNGSKFEYGETQLYFEGIEIKERELWRIVNDGEPDAEYYIGGKQVTEEEILKYLEDNPKTKIKFSPLEVSWVYPISLGDAVFLAQKYWNPLGEEGKTECIIVPGYNVDAPLFVYVIIKRHYVTDHWSTIDEIWIHKHTGEAIVPYAPDGKG